MSFTGAPLKPPLSLWLGLFQFSQLRNVKGYTYSHTHLFNVLGRSMVVLETISPSTFSSNATSAMSFLSSFVRSGAIFTSSGIRVPGSESRVLMTLERSA